MRERAEQHQPTLIQFPFALPERFLERVGYHGNHNFIALWWEPAGDELTVSDGRTTWSGYLDLMRQPQVFAWRTEHMVNLGGSEEPATHWLIVDRQQNRGYVVEARQAKRIVQNQRLEPEP